eukprot:8499401-Pyramimonas_sp.AAC.1
MVLRSHVFLYGYGALGFDIRAKPEQVFDGFRHVRATTRARALRSTACNGFSRQHARKGVRTISMRARSQ